MFMGALWSTDVNKVVAAFSVGDVYGGWHPVFDLNHRHISLIVSVKPSYPSSV